MKTNKVTILFLCFFSLSPLYSHAEEKLNSDHKRGWGLQLMKELMDTVEFQSNKDGTTVTMTKNR